MAVTAMAGWHLYMIACGETSVESQDHEQYRRFAGRRGEVSRHFVSNTTSLMYSFPQTFVNCYDLGYLRNLQLFFNIGEDG